MADFDLEQLKSIFDRLADRLDRTDGDKESIKQLENVNNAIKQLEKTIADQNSGGGSSNQQTNTILQNFVASWTQTQRANNAGGGQGTGGGPNSILSQYANSIKDSGQTAGKSFNLAGKSARALSSSFSSVSHKLSDFGKGLDGSVASFGAMIGLSGGISGKLFAAIDDNIKLYRDLTASGESSIRSIEGMRAAAQQFNLTPQQLVDAIAKGTDGARLLGAQQFGSLYKNFKNATASVANFGMSIDQILSAQNTYAQMLKEQGDINTMSEDQMNTGLQQLIKSSNVTASILGKNRDEVLKARENEAQDKNFNTYLQTVSDEQANALREFVTYVDQAYGKEYAQLAKEQVMANGGVTTQQSGQLAALDPRSAQTLNATIQEVKNSGRFNQVALAEMQQANNKARTDSERHQFALMGTMDSGFAGAITAINTADLNAQSIMPKKASDGTDQRGLINEAVAFEDSMRRLRAEISKLIDSAIIPFIQDHAPKLIKGIGWLTDWLTNLKDPGAALIGGIGSIIVAMTALKVGMMALQAWIMSKMIGGFMGKGAGSVGGRILAGGAGRAAAGAGLAGLGGVAAVGGGALLGVGGSVLGGMHVANNANESFLGQKEGEGGFFDSRGSGYLAAMGTGAAGGALAGSAFAGVGAIPGAVLGGALGLTAAVLGDIMGKKDDPAHQVSPENRKTQTQTTNSRVADKTDAPNQTASSRQPVTMETLTTRIATLTETGNIHLRAISENNRAQLELMREEVAIARDFYSRSLKLNEETNRALRNVGSLN